MVFDNISALQTIALYLFPTAVFMAVFFAGLGYYHFYNRDPGERMTEIKGKYPDGIEERNAPFPLVLVLLIGGAVLWAVFYIMAYGLSDARI